MADYRMLRPWRDLIWLIARAMFQPWDIVSRDGKRPVLTQRPVSQGEISRIHCEIFHGGDQSACHGHRFLRAARRRHEP